MNDADPPDGELDRLRGEIDRVNDRILEALNERARLARAIGTLKVGQAFRPEREAQVLRHIKEANQGPLSGETVALLFREIMSACLALERPTAPSVEFSTGTTPKSAAPDSTARKTSSIEDAGMPSAACPKCLKVARSLKVPLGPK